MKKLTIYALGIVLCLATRATAIWVYSNYIANETATYTKTYPLNLNSTYINTMSAQVTYSSATAPTSTFKDGSVSTGTITVVSTASLVAINSTATITLLNNNIPNGVHVTVAGTRLYNGINWFVGNTSSNTAVSIVNAINYQTAWHGISASTTTATKITVFCGGVADVNCGGGTMFVTTSSITVSSGFSGGQPAGILTVNGTKLTAGTQWAVSLPTTTAKNIATAINTAFSGVIVSTAPDGSSVVYATSAVTGVSTNYSWSSNTTGLTVSNTSLFGGTAAAYAAASPNFTIPAHGLSTGYGVVFSTPTGTGISPLVSGTTYFVIVVDSNTLKLASTQNNAIAGTALIPTTASLTGPHTFTITPQTLTGTVGLVWQVSNDCATYANMPNVSSVTFASPYTAGAQSWDFGSVGYQCVQAALTGPTTGGVVLKIKVNGK